MATSNSPATIAGANSGVKVVANAAASVVFKNLKVLATKGNHWAALIVKEISSLSSGHFKNSVYVKTFNGGDKRVMFTMVLPGCKAKILKRTNGQYLLYAMEVDNSYAQMQAEGERPGLFEVKKESGRWLTTYKNNGKIKNQTNRIVAISDSSMKTLPNERASIVAPFVADAPIGGGSYIDNDGFDMHYTPGQQKIGGVRKITQARNADTDKELHETAILLAKTMSDARNTKQVRWISERGGSGVLTQAMRILKDKNINFKDQNHLVFFSHPTTSLIKAQQLATDLGLKFDRDTKKVNRLNVDELVGGLGIAGGHIAAYNRFKSDPEHTALKLGADLVKETVAAKNAASTIAITTGAVTAALGFTAGTGGLGAVATIAAAASTIAGVGTTLTKAWLRDRYNQIASKL